MKNTEIIRGWENLSEYLHGISVSTLISYSKKGIIKKRKLGSQVFFYKSEIDAAIKEVD